MGVGAGLAGAGLGRHMSGFGSTVRQSGMLTRGRSMQVLGLGYSTTPLHALLQGVIGPFTDAIAERAAET